MQPIHPVILSGGMGSRLWPLSRVQQPKQFQPIDGAAGLDLRQQVFEGLLDPDPEAVSEGPFQGPGVRGNRRDGLHHLVGDVVEGGAQDANDVGRQLMPGLIGQNSYLRSKI